MKNFILIITYMLISATLVNMSLNAFFIFFILFTILGLLVSVDRQTKELNAKEKTRGWHHES